MARIDWIEQRLQNWARWKVSRGGGSLGYASVNLQSAIGNDRPEDAGPAIPTIDCEAVETDDAVERLPSELKATVQQVYLGRGGVKDHMRRLACSESTIKARIWRAHRMLADHFLAKQDRRKAERERVQTLIDAARPR